jgi:hypothetical protein
MSGISPELALVDPDLRAYALAALPSVRPFAFLELRPVSIPEPRAVAPAFHVSAALAYLALAIWRTVAFDAVVFAGVAAVVLIASVFG